MAAKSIIMALSGLVLAFSPPALAQSDTSASPQLENTASASKALKPADQNASSTTKSTKATPLAAIPDYRFNALRADGGQITLGGSLPDKDFVNYVGTIIKSAPGKYLLFKRGGPKNFRVNVILGLKALSQLQSGLLSYENRRWTLVGDAVDAGRADAARATVFSLENGKDWIINIALVPTFANCAAAVSQFSQRHTILFTPASSKLTGASAKALVDLASELKKCPDASLYVEGHTDSDGPAAANMALSVARAEAVSAELVSLGIKDTRLYAVGYGETLPVASNRTRAGKAQNRRIVFKLVK